VFSAPAIDGLKASSGPLGKLYSAYVRMINKIPVINKTKRSKPFKKEGYEYKIFKVDGEVYSYRSKIKRLDENIFKQIHGEIDRITYGSKLFNSHFKAYIKNDERDYLIWEESFKNNQGNFHISGHFRIFKSKENIPGICIEERNGIVTQSFCVLSFRGSTYQSVQKLLEDIDNYQDYIEPLNIFFKDFNSKEKNRFITV
jgi:hypothetical protein